MKKLLGLFLALSIPSWGQAPAPGPYLGVTKFTGIVLKSYAITPTTEITGTTVLNKNAAIRIYNGSQWVKADGTAGGF